MGQYMGTPEPLTITDRDDGVSNWLFVVRRNLKVLPFGKARAAAHSGLLIRFQRQYHLVEYMASGKVVVTSVRAEDVQGESFQLGSDAFFKQQHGKPLPPELSLDRIVKTMQALMDIDGGYDFNNCRAMTSF